LARNTILDDARSELEWVI
jgi:hypothetical protein